MDKNNAINLGIREVLEYFRDKYTPKYACSVSDRSPSKLTKLDLTSLMASTPEQMLVVYNSLVDSHNALIDRYDRLKEELQGEGCEKK